MIGKIKEQGLGETETINIIGMENMMHKLYEKIDRIQMQRERTIDSHDMEINISSLNMNEFADEKELYTNQTEDISQTIETTIQASMKKYTDEIASSFKDMQQILASQIQEMKVDRELFLNQQLASTNYDKNFLTPVKNNDHLSSAISLYDKKKFLPEFNSTEQAPDQIQIAIPSKRSSKHIPSKSVQLVRANTGKIKLGNTNNSDDEMKEVEIENLSENTLISQGRESQVIEVDQISSFNQLHLSLHVGNIEIAPAQKRGLSMTDLNQMIQLNYRKRELNVHTFKGLDRVPIIVEKEPKQTQNESNIKETIVLTTELLTPIAMHPKPPVDTQEPIIKTSIETESNNKPPMAKIENVELGVLYSKPPSHSSIAPPLSIFQIAGRQVAPSPLLVPDLQIPRVTKVQDDFVFPGGNESSPLMKVIKYESMIEEKRTVDAEMQTDPCVIRENSRKVIELIAKSSNLSRYRGYDQEKIDLVYHAISGLIKCTFIFANTLSRLSTHSNTTFKHVVTEFMTNRVTRMDQFGEIKKRKETGCYLLKSFVDNEMLTVERFLKDATSSMVISPVANLNKSIPTLYQTGKLVPYDFKAQK